MNHIFAVKRRTCAPISHYSFNFVILTKDSSQGFIIIYSYSTASESIHLIFNHHIFFIKRSKNIDSFIMHNRRIIQDHRNYSFSSHHKNYKSNKHKIIHQDAVVPTSYVHFILLSQVKIGSWHTFLGSPNRTKPTDTNIDLSEMFNR